MSRGRKFHTSGIDKDTELINDTDGKQEKTFLISKFLTSCAPMVMQPYALLAVRYKFE